MLSTSQITAIDWKKVDGLIPAIIQDSHNGKVLMLGYMNEQALQVTIESKKVTFYSRTKQRLWTKGETSDHCLFVEDISIDCDNDTLLIMASPQGPTCHLGTLSCFNDSAGFDLDFINQLNTVINDRYLSPDDNSYTSSLFKSGVKRMAQKVGEEGVEVALAAATNDRDELINESSDLLYHLLVLLRAQDVPVTQIMDNLRRRHQA